jgi:hypothetical protein
MSVLTSSANYMGVLKSMFEIVPSDEQSALAVYQYLISLRMMLSDLKDKASGLLFEYDSVKLIYSMCLDKLRMMNLPFHYVFE